LIESRQQIERLSQEKTLSLYLLPPNTCMDRCELAFGYMYAWRLRSNARREVIGGDGKECIGVCMSVGDIGFGWQVKVADSRTFA